MILYGRQNITADDIAAVVSVLKSDFLTTGPSVSAFEKALCKQTGAKHAIVCSNGTTALHLACMALGVKSGDIGLTTPITFLASANCVEFCGAKADFADISNSTLCLSPDAVEEYCKKGTIPKVVIPVSFAGIPAELPKFKVLSDKYGFKLIEDACHAIGSTYTHNKHEYECGSCAHTDLAVFSFHPVKTITTGEGGAVLTNDDVLAEKVRRFRSHGMTKPPEKTKNAPWYYEMPEISNNYRLTDMQCALGLSQIKRLAEIKEKRQQIVKRYNDAFEDMSSIVTPPWPAETSPCQHLYPIQFTDGEGLRKKIYDKLLAVGVQTQVHYIPVYWQPYYENKYAYKKGLCPNAEAYYNRCLSLPLYPELTEEQQTLIVDTIKSSLS